MANSLNPFTQSFIHSFMHSFTFLHAGTHPFTPSFIHAFIHLFIHSLIHSFIQSFMHAFIPTFTHAFMQRLRSRPQLGLQKHNQLTPVQSAVDQSKQFKTACPAGPYTLGYMSLGLTKKRKVSSTHGDSRGTQPPVHNLLSFCMVVDLSVVSTAEGERHSLHATAAV